MGHYFGQLLQFRRLLTSTPHQHHENLLHAHQPTPPPSTVQPFWRLANALDCRIYAMAALEILNPNFEKLIENLTKTEVEEAPKQPKTMKEAPPVVKKGGGFVNAWR